MRNFVLVLSLLALCVLGAAQPDIEPLRLSADPTRAVTLYVGSDRALIQEHAQVWLKPGANELRLRWVDAGIDAASVDIQVPADVQVSSPRQPAGETNTLAWTLTAPSAGPRAVSSSYFLKGIAWAPTYELAFDPSTGTGTLTGKLQIQNDTKLALRDATIRLQPAPTTRLDAAPSEAANYLELTDVDLLAGWQLRVPFVSATTVPAQVVCRADWEGSKQDVRRVLLADLRGLALPGPLPKGHVEVLETRDGALIPVTAGDLDARTDRPTELDLGVERGMVFERKTMARRKQSIEYDKAGRVAGYDSVEDVAVSLRNRTGADVRVELIEKTPGKTTIACKLTAADEDPTDPNQITWPVNLKPGETATVNFTITRKVGTKGD